MDISLTPEQSAFVRDAVSSGRVVDPPHAFHEAMGLWIEWERRRADLLASLDSAESSIARGHSIAVTSDSMRMLTEDVMERCAARVQASRTTNR